MALSRLFLATVPVIAWLSTSSLLCEREPDNKPDRGQRAAPTWPSLLDFWLSMRSVTPAEAPAWSCSPVSHTLPVSPTELQGMPHSLVRAVHSVNRLNAAVWLQIWVCVDLQMCLRLSPGWKL